MARMFGTDGVRGVAGSELTSELAYALGQAGAVALRKGQTPPRILIGRDTRISGCMLESALVAGICSWEVLRSLQVLFPRRLLHI